MTHLTRITIIGFAFVAVAIWGLANAISKQYVADAVPQQWEYHTTDIRLSELQDTALNDLGKKGWEVFSVVRLPALNSQQGDDKTTTQVRVLAKRLSTAN